MDKAQKTLIKNKKLGKDYEVVERLEAGISLLGHEVKAIKDGLGSLGESFVSIKDGTAVLQKAFIPPYQPKNTPESYDPHRQRMLLLNKKELDYLREKVKGSGLTIVPFSLYNKGRNIKVELCLVRGKKKFDKRQSIKKRDTERDLGRRLKN